MLADKDNSRRQTFSVKLLVCLLKGYRVLFSGFSAGHCRFYPSCSYYAEGCLKKYGLLRALPRILGRLLTCHPWHAGGLHEP